MNIVLIVYKCMSIYIYIRIYSGMYICLAIHTHTHTHTHPVTPHSHLWTIQSMERVI